MFTDNCIGLQCKVQFKLKRLHPHPMSQTGEWGIRGKQKRRGFLLFPPSLEGKVGSPQLLFHLSLGKASKRISSYSSDWHQHTAPARGRHRHSQAVLSSAESPRELGENSCREPCLALPGWFPFPCPGLAQHLPFQSRGCCPEPSSSLAEGAVAGLCWPMVRGSSPRVPLPAEHQPRLGHPSSACAACSGESCWAGAARAHLLSSP